MKFVDNFDNLHLAFLYCSNDTIRPYTKKEEKFQESKTNHTQKQANRQTKQTYKLIKVLKDQQVENFEENPRISKSEFQLS